MSGILQKDFVMDEWLPGLIAGDTHACEHLFRRYYGKVLNFISLFVKRSQDAEDIAQDIFVKLWERRKSLDKVRSSIPICS